MRSLLKDKKIIILLIILILSIFGFFKGITFSTIEGIVYLEAKHKDLYSTQYASLEKQKDYQFITKIESDDESVKGYMNKEGYELIDRHGSIFIFSNGSEKEIFSRNSILNKYYIWKN